ncbi:hypothetical protein [Lewinella sp. W8]|uniref:hypothetical protein n=1 Tax=Lewinella sp. W8 TaxID=2528208 RepID=UPI0010687CD6|nr:hypothetical protein [Lewinella sp. W8]MTB53086.1 hypothetical protein [Lewinella sp. W8]
MTGKQWKPWSLWILLFLGGSLWVLAWWSSPALFIDEANVARNVFDRSFGGLFSPQDYGTYAPPLYLVLTKLCGEIFGYGERALRLPALLGGMLAVIGLLSAGRHLRLGWWRLLLLAFLFVNPTTLRYVNEIKPYALDLGISALLLARALRSLRPGWSWALWGCLAIWTSLPAIFLLAAIGLTGLLCTRGNARLKWFPVGFLWLLAFALLYFLVLQPSVGDPELNKYHQAYFFNVSPGSIEEFIRTLVQLNSPIKLAFGFTALAMFGGWALYLSGLLQDFDDRKLLFALPLLIVLAASSVKLYSLIPRLLLFLLPPLWLAATIGARSITDNLPGKYWRYAMIAGLLLILGSTNVVRHYLHPLKFSESRIISTDLQPGFQPLLHYSTLPTYDYYRRIHPRSRDREERPVIQSIREAERPGKYVLLFDVLTQQNVRESMRRDTLWATERGCKVDSRMLFRGAQIYLDCP